MTRKTKRVLVTGGASGLGATVARMLRERGDRVFVVDRQAHTEDPSLTADLAVADGIRPALEEAVARLGGLDAAVLAAGINVPGHTEELDPGEIERVLSVNATGTILSAQAVLPHLARTAGRLIFVGSTLSMRGNLGQVAYSASKHAMLGALRSLGHEYRGTVGLGMVNPGAMETPLFRDRSPEFLPPKGAMIDPQAVGEAIVFMIDQPKGVAIREVTITGYDAHDWP